MSATWVERLRDELGLKGVHQVWDERPAWYIWLADGAGAYGLELVHAEEDGGLVRGVFGLKFYPSPHTTFWWTFSPQERSLASGEMFDQSGAPAFEAKDQIPPNMFNVGVMELATNLEQDWCCFSLSALSECRLVRPGNGGAQADHVLERRAPGWRLSHALFDKLLCLHAFASKHTPLQAALSTEPGFEVVAAAGAPEQTRPCPPTRNYSLSVLFGPAPQLFPISLENWWALGPQAEPGVEIMSQSFTCRHYHPWDGAVEGQPVLNQQWWSLAQADYKSNLASACGCEHH